MNIERTTGLRQYGGELFTFPTEFGSVNPALVGGVIGQKYYFPQGSMLWPIAKVVAYNRTTGMDLTAGSVGRAMRDVSINAWFLTLCEPSGQYIVHNMPLFRLQTIPSLAAVQQEDQAPLYFNPRTIADPLQSYLTTTVDGLVGGNAPIPILEFQYVRG